MAGPPRHLDRTTMKRDANPWAWLVAVRNAALPDGGPLLLALLPVVLLPQLIGGVHPEIAAASALYALLVVAFLFWQRRRRGVRVSSLGAPLAVGIVATAAQLVPLPHAIRALLSGESTELKAFVLGPLPDDARAAFLPALSFDPPSSAAALLRLVAAACVFVVVTDGARRRRGRQLVYRMLAIAGAAVFITALLHRLLGVQGAWGMFTHKGSFFFAPLVNPNQLARVFGALALVCAARAMTVRGAIESLAFVAVATACGAGVLATYSRGGVLTFAVGLILLFALAWRSNRVDDEVGRYSGTSRGDWRQQTRGLRVLRIALPVVLLVALGAGIMAARDALAREFSDVGAVDAPHLERTKLAILRPALELARENWTVGVGNNAFAVAFTRKSDGERFDGTFTYSHAENVVAGTLAEHGLVVGGALLALGLLITAVLFTRLARLTDAAALPALAFLVWGDLTDFALETTAGVVLLAVLLGLAAARLVDGPQAVPMRRVTARTGAAVLAVGVVALLPLAKLAIVDGRLRLDREIAAARGAERAQLIARALAAHPLDAQYAYLLATEARADKDPKRALLWANRAQNLWPAHRGAHIEAARALWVQGHTRQALLEYKLAWVAGSPAKGLIDEVARRTRDPALRQSALPDEPTALAHLCEALLAEKALDDAQRCFDHATSLPGADDALRVRGVETALTRQDGAGAKARLGPLLAGKSVDLRTITLTLRALELTDGAAAALAESERYLDRAADRRSLLEWRLAAAVRLRDAVLAEKTFAALKAEGGDASFMDRLDFAEMELRAMEGNRSAILKVIERLCQRHPTDVSLMVRRGLTELQLDLLPAAGRSLEQAERTGSDRADVQTLRRQFDAAMALRAKAPAP